MRSSAIISNDRQARESRTAIAELDATLSSEHILASIVRGLPEQVVNGVRKSLSTERRELAESLKAYLDAKDGRFDLLKKKAGDDPGAQLIVARIIKGLSQKDLARKLGLREQAIQRYEAEKYRSISLANFQKIASVLGVNWTIDLPRLGMGNGGVSFDIPPAQARKVLKHARDHGWLDRDDRSDEDAYGQLVRYVADHVVKYGTPSLLRTGMNISDQSHDWSLLSWKAQVTKRAETLISVYKLKYTPLDVAWLLDLVRLSVYDDAPLRAQTMLREHGIVLVVEPHIAGMPVDGAAFLVDDVPVVGLTLLRDTLDNFWFTLLHEIAHIVLHFRTGLTAGFFDDFESPDVDELEQEANDFAGNMLVPEEIWRRSPARIAKTAAPIEKLADNLKIHPAILFGRIRMERKNYTLFSNKIGRGAVRRQLFHQGAKVD